ncbi:MAG: SdpI family protein [Armatimonadetes bacterium]|nr:SdpI family protein [Armatimonadota bacterium]
MRYRALFIGGLVLIAVTVAYTLSMYNRLPETIATHWNIHGQPDQFSPRNWAVLFGPIAQIALWLVFLALPSLSPPKADLSRFSDTYAYVCLLVIGFMGVVQFLMLEAAVRPIDMSKWVVVCVLGLFGLMGNVMTRAKRNYWMGFRTPWTLESEEVWNRTHRLGGRLMFVGGFGGMLLVLAGLDPMMVTVSAVLLTLWPVVYSYLLFRRLRGSSL